MAIHPASLVLRQLEQLYELEEHEQDLLDAIMPQAMKRVMNCLGAIAHKYYRDENGIPYFDPYHSGHYCLFLSYLSQQAGLESSAKSLATKIYLLNKALHAVDFYFEVNFPDVFMVEHPVGTVLGRARYSNYLVIQQGCTIGGNRSAYPELGEYVWLHAQAMIIGKCRIGNNVFLSAGSIVMDCDVPDNTIVFGRSPNLIFKEKVPAYFHTKSPFAVHQNKRD